MGITRRAFATLWAALFGLRPTFDWWDPHSKPHDGRVWLTRVEASSPGRVGMVALSRNYVGVLFWQLSPGSSIDWRARPDSPVEFNRLVNESTVPIRFTVMRDGYVYAIDSDGNIVPMTSGAPPLVLQVT